MGGFGSNTLLDFAKKKKKKKKKKREVNKKCRFMKIQESLLR